MRKMVKTSMAALMLTCMAGNVWAAAASAAGCARPEDMNALKAAAIQQRLMVAALSCNAASAYNTFVKAYQTELQAADHALQDYFRRLSGAAAGTEKYHAYKTHLANASSMQSIRNITGYCADAQAAFDASLSGTTSGLASFISGQPMTVDEAYKPCEVVRTAESTEAAQSLPLPKVKPGETATPARDVALAPN
jgi:hypothetical protein